MENRGKYAEFLAKTMFRLKKYRIIAENYVTGRGTNAGEIDFIAQKGNEIIFVEVKKRKTLTDAAYSISETQKKRIIKGAEAFLKNHPQYQDCDCRFDVVLVDSPLNIEHIPNAFTLQDFEY